jgi:hypothetical protein
MNKLIFAFAVLALSISTAAFADTSEQVITLKDGSQLKGELTGISNGVYTIKAPIIGDVHAAVSDVVSITNSNAPTAAVAALPTTATPNQAPANSSSYDQQIAAGQKQLMSNPQSMATLQEMMQDPEIMQALQDPALVAAVTSHNYQAVQSNPNVQKLLNNPKMQALLQKLAAQQQQQNSPSQ